MLLEPKRPLKARNRGGLESPLVLEASTWCIRMLEWRLEGKSRMGIDNMDVVDTMRRLGISYPTRLVPVIKAILACSFVTIADLT